MNIQELKSNYRVSLFNVKAMRKYRDRAIKTWTQSLEMTDESSLLAQRLRQSAVSISLNLLEYEIDMAAHYLGELNSMLEAQAREAQ